MHFFLFQSISLHRSFLLGATVTSSISGNVQTIDGSGIIEPADIRKGIFSKVTDVIIKGTIEEISSSAFSMHTSLKNVDIQGTIKIIGGSAFPYCLRSINLGTHLTSIGHQSFISTQVTQIHIPPTTTKINVQCFMSCTLLSQLIFDDIETSVLKTIAYQAFHNAPIVSLVLPKSVETIGYKTFNAIKIEIITLGSVITDFYGAFSGSSVKTITIDPSNTNFIKKGSFIYKNDGVTLYSIEDSSLTNIKINAGTTKIGKYAFYYSSVSQIEFVDTITCFENNAFDSCIALQSITLPADLNEIQDFCFYAAGLTSLKITKNVAIIGSSVFTLCLNLISITVDKDNQQFESDDQNMLYNKNKTLIIFIPIACQERIELPSTIKQLAVGQFRQCQFTYLILNEGITLLPFTCCHQCPKLKEIRIPQSVTRMEEAAIGSCPNLESIIFEPNSQCTTLALSFYYNPLLHTVDFGANSKLKQLSSLSGCKSLVNINIPSSVTSIGGGCFEGCSSLGSLSLSSQIGITIGQNAFRWCSNLSILTLDLPEITDGAFASCTGLTKLILSDKITRIGANSFANCQKLNKIIFENIEGSGLKRIESLGFSECTNLINITLPSSIESVTASSFSYSTNLMNINIHINVDIGGETILKPIYRSIEGVVYKGENLEQTLVACPNGRTNLGVIEGTRILGENSFTGCGLLINVYFNSDINEISSYCFSGCSLLRELNIPIGTKKVGIKAFEGCISLKLIYFCSNDPIPFGDESPFLSFTKIIVKDTYSSELFLNHPVIKSKSIDSSDCPIMPTNIFTIKPNRQKQLKSQLNKIFTLLFIKLISVA